MKDYIALCRDHELKTNTPEEEIQYYEIMIDQLVREREYERLCLPCPFCGERPEVNAYPPRYKDGDFDNWGIECTNPDCGVTMFSESEDFECVLERWNRRDYHIPGQVKLQPPAEKI